VNEKGLVLQALRYFVASDFLTKPPPWEADDDDGDDGDADFVVDT
jgi:hypothetical protein